MSTFVRTTNGKVVYTDNLGRVHGFDPTENVLPDPQDANIIVITNSASASRVQDGFKVAVDLVTAPVATDRNDLITQLSAQFFFRIAGNIEGGDLTPQQEEAIDSLLLVGESRIPIKGAGNTFVNSALRETEERIISSKSIEVPPGTVFIGANIGISGSIRGLNVYDEDFDRRALLISQIYTDAGNQDTFSFDIAALTDSPINPNIGVIQDNAQFVIRASNPFEIVRFLRARTTTISGQVDFSIFIRLNSHSGTIVYSVSGQQATNEEGVFTVMLANPLFLDNTFDLYVTVTCNGLVGSIPVSDFIPNSVAEIQVVTPKAIATQEYVQNLLLFEPPTIVFFSTNQPLVVDAGTTITGNIQFTYNVSNTANVQGNLSLTQDGNSLSTSIDPSGFSVTEAVNSITLSAGQTTSFVLAGMDTQGNRFESTITIRARRQEEIMYYCDSDTIDPNIIDINSLAVADVAEGTQVTVRFDIPNTHYAVILSPSDRNISSILETAFNQEILSSFDKTEDVRTINGQLYDLYVHQNNSGVHGVLETLITLA